MKISKWTAVGIILALCAYQAPNLALLAYKAGVSLVDTSFLGVQVSVRNGWYPVATSQSLAGKAILPPETPPLVAFHRPSLLWPWRGEVFAVMSYLKPVDPGAIELTKDTSWGRAMLLEASRAGNSTQRLFVVPDLHVAILGDDASVIDDVATLTRVAATSKSQQQ